MYRSNAYNEGAFFTPVPVFRQMVVPGQSVELDLDVMFETPPFLGNLMSGGVAQLYAFYCPFRLVWKPWMEFIADPESGLSVPVTTTPWAFMFEKAGAGVLQVNSFMRRAYKLAFNQYFGSTPDNFDSWYANVDDDTDVTYRRVRTTDQFLGKLMKDSSISDPSYVAPVAGASATISLNDFRQAMRDAFSVRRADMTGDKYVDAMRRMGVDLNWSLQMVPEFLGQASIEFEPKDTRATYTGVEPDNPATGQSYSRYQEKVRLRTPRKFFAEHGYVFAVLVVRPFDFSDGFKSPADAAVYSFERFFRGDNVAGTDDIASSLVVGGANEVVKTPRFQYLRSGHNMIGLASANPWISEDASAGVSDSVYPTLIVPQIPQLDHQMAVFCRAKSMGPTPVKPMVL